MQYSLSPSRLGLLEVCPRCFWLENVGGMPRPQTPFPTLMSGIDRILKERFDSFRAKGELPPELGKEGVDAGLFRDLGLLNKWRSNREGLRYVDGENGVVLRGLVDEVLQKGDRLIVLDFKTRGTELKEETAHYSQDQLNIYNFLLRKNGYETEDYSYLLYYIPEKINGNGDFIFDTRLVKMNTDVGHAEALFKKGIEVLKGGMPGSSPECGFCRWHSLLKGSGI